MPTRKINELNKSINFTGYNRQLLLWTLFLVFMIRISTLGFYPLMDKTEARYAEIAREMVATNNWITPQLEPGHPFWGKPPFSFWLSAMSFKVFGVNEFAARFPSFILSLLTVYLTFLLGKKLKNEICGLVSAVILATTGLFLINAGSVMTDPSLVFSVTLSLISFVMVFLVEESFPKKLWGYLFFIGLGISLLAKGPVGWVLTFIPLVIWCAWHNQWKNAIKNLPWFTGIILTLMISVPWYILAEKSTPGFLKYFFIGEHWHRFVTKGWKGDLYGSAHAQPKGMIWLFIVPATLPWIILFFGATVGLIKNAEQNWQNFRKDKWFSYLLFWFLSPVLFFSLAGNILITYLLPALPAFAVLMSMTVFLQNVLSQKLKPWFSSEKTFTAIALGFPIIFFCAAISVLPSIARDNSQREQVQLFDRMKKNNNSLLIYIQSMPESAVFYTKGRAVLFPDHFSERMGERLKDDNNDFFVIQKNDLNKFPAEQFAQIREVGRFKKNILFEEIDFKSAQQ